MKDTVEIIKPLVSRYIGDGLHHVQQLEFKAVVDDVEVHCVLPENFVCDMHSTPFFVRWLLPKYVLGMNASAAGHDYMYRFWRILNISRKVADRIYLLLSFRETVTLPSGERSELRAKALIMYRAVRRFGWTAWGRGDGTPSKRIQKAMKRCGL